MIRGFLLLTAGLALSAVAATVAVAAATVSQLELARWVQTRLRGAGQVAALRENPSRLLATANAITTIGLILAATALPAMLARTTPTFLGIFTFFVAVPLLVSVSYLVPRVMGRRWAEPIVAWSLPWVERIEGMLGPFVPSRTGTASPRSALAAALTDVDTQALASSDEMAVVSGVLAFSDRPVRELMTPRTAIVAIPEGMLAAEAAHVFAQAGYSRYPVHRGSLDDVAGVVHIFDLLRVAPDEPVPVRPTLVIPGTLRAADLMLRMQRGGGHLAVVLDEHGGTAGLVTFDDLLRDLVAEVFGEGPPTEAVAPSGTRLLEIEGNAPLTSVAEAFGTSIGAWGVQTVGGFLIQAVGRIPRSGERFTVSGLEFDVLQATPTRVERVAVRAGPVRAVALDQPPPTPPPAPEGGRA
jgi:putative hemolysin